MPDANKLTLGKLYKYFIIALTGKDTDFTSGSIRKAIFMLSIPMVLEMLMESIFALVDIAYVSRVSVNAVATIGLTESYRLSYWELPWLLLLEYLELYIPRKSSV